MFAARRQSTGAAIVKATQPSSTTGAELLVQTAKQPEQSGGEQSPAQLRGNDAPASTVPAPGHAERFAAGVRRGGINLADLPEQKDPYRSQPALSKRRASL
jgi:hypothetical protein